MVFVLKIWRYYLYGENFAVYSDHKSMKHIFTQKDLNMRKRIWVELLKDYEFKLNYYWEKAKIAAETPKGIWFCCIVTDVSNMKDYELVLEHINVRAYLAHIVV